MMKHIALIAAAGAAALAATAPAAAQSRAEEDRWEAAQRRFEHERSAFERERERYEAARRRDEDRRYYGDRPDRYDSDRYDSDRYATDYDAARHYRDDPRYAERVLGPDDHVYRGSDGRYYCRRPDGTTGLIVGGAAGGVLGNVIDGGRRRTAGTLIGGALGALLGREIERRQVRCR